MATRRRAQIALLSELRALPSPQPRDFHHGAHLEGVALAMVLERRHHLATAELGRFLGLQHLVLLLLRSASSEDALGLIVREEDDQPVAAALGWGLRWCGVLVFERLAACSWPSNDRTSRRVLQDREVVG